MKKIRFILSIIACAAMLSCSVGAAQVYSTPYLGYEFNNDDNSVPAPVGFELKTAVHDYDMRFANGLGNAKEIVYDGTDSQNPYTLIRTDSKIIKSDTEYNVVAVYDIPNCASFSSFAFNGNNGYIFAVANGALQIYNTNGVYVKTVTPEQLGTGAAPEKVLHIGERYAVLSGGNIVYLDGTGSVDEKTALSALPVDFYYSASADAVYLLSQSTVTDITNDITYNTGKAFSKSARFVSDTSGEKFYIADGGTLYCLDTSEEICTSMSLPTNVISIAYNDDKDNLGVLFGSDGLNLSEYSGSELIRQHKNYKMTFTELSDLLYDGEKYIYILDGANGRIIKTDVSLTPIYDIYESFIDGENKLSATGASGFWIDGKRLIIADTEHERVIISDFSGNVQKVVVKPEELTGLSAPFRASKVLTDRNGRLYVIAESVNMGAFVFSKNYEYEHFFGSNTVLTTSEAIYNYIKKLFLNKEQKRAMQSNTPITLSNFDIDKNGFIYAVTETDQKFVSNNTSSILRKINYTGSDILGDGENKLKFGDLEWNREKKVTNTSFIDVDVSAEGWITALDGIRGKVFQYSPDGELISVFGGIGTQYGLMNMPVALESIGENIYVADSYGKCINVYSPTDYVAALHDAFSNIDTSDLELTVAKWNKVLSMNSNNSYAYYGLGVAYENAGDYAKAMENFKIANAKEQYSKAYKEYRKEYIDRHLPMLALIIAAGAFLIVLCVKKLSRLFIVPENETYAPIESKRGMPLYVLFHPADGFAQFRTRGVNSTGTAIGIAVAAFFIKIFEYFKQGFIFNSNRPINYSLASTLFGTLLIYVLFVVSNLAIASFLDGKGNIKQIAAMTSYSLIPFLSALLINIGLSNILALDEEIFMSIILTLGGLWSLILLVVGSVEVHEYSVGKTVLSLILTVLAMLIFVVLGVLLFSLVKELISFVKSVMYELSLR